MQKNKILLVEDEFFLAEMLKGRLEFAGYSVTCAEEGAHALSILKTDTFDLIIMDAIMPIMDGYQTCQKIKADPKLKKTPVIFLTARAREEDKKQAFDVGADDYLTKPFEVDDLIVKIEQWAKK